MCTVTLFAHRSAANEGGSGGRVSDGGDNGCGGKGDVIRLACNRDEQRQRRAALSPRVCVIGQRRALMPIDPASGGTWVAVNDAGLIATLLNVNPGAEGDFLLRGNRQSRGVIIPSLLHANSVHEAMGDVERIAPSEYWPFRLVLVDDFYVAQVVGDGESLDIRCETFGRQPYMYTSSGLGDALVEGPRRDLFERSFGDDVTRWSAQQAAFHQHRWTDRPQLSVCMSRDDACTVSYTVIETDAHGVRLTYHAAPPDQASEPVTIHLARVTVKQ